jgi:hypothetical protein
MEELKKYFIEQRNLLEIESAAEARRAKMGGNAAM